MPGHSDTGTAAGPGAVSEREQSSGMSRRSVLRRAAGAGAAGLAAAAGASAVAAAARSGAPGAHGAAPAAPVAMPAHAEPVVVYLRDAATGELDVFTGTSQVRFRDPAIAARLLRAVQ